MAKNICNAISKLKRLGLNYTSKLRSNSQFMFYKRTVFKIEEENIKHLMETLLTIRSKVQNCNIQTLKTSSQS